MPRYIIKLSEDNKDYYMLWSTVVDAPVTYGVSLEEFTELYRREYGEHGMRYDFDERMKRVEEKGTSDLIHENVDDLIAWNRAGENEECLSKKEIIDHYCNFKMETDGE